METEHDGHLRRSYQAHIGTRRGWSAHAPHMKASVRSQAVGVAMIQKNAQEYPENDFIFCSLMRKHVKREMISNGRGSAISMNIFVTKRSGQFPLPTQKYRFDLQADPKL